MSTENKNKDVQQQNPKYESTGFDYNAPTAANTTNSDEISETNYSTLSVQQSIDIQENTQGAEGGINLTQNTQKQQQQQQEAEPFQSSQDFECQEQGYKNEPPLSEDQNEPQQPHQLLSQQQDAQHQEQQHIQPSSEEIEESQRQILWWSAEQQIEKLPELIGESKQQLTGSNVDIHVEQLSTDEEQLTITIPISTTKPQIGQKIPISFRDIHYAQKENFVNLKINANVTQTLAQKFLPPRPDADSKRGKPLELIINCLNVSIKPMKIFVYHIELTKAEFIGVDQRKRDLTVKIKKEDLLRNVINKFLDGKEGCPVFDGGRIIFNNKLLPFENGVQPTFYYDLDGENINCHFTIQHFEEENINLEDLVNYVRSGNSRSDYIPEEALRVLDTIMREIFLNKNLISIGKRAIYDPKTLTPMRCGPYVLMDGYSTSIRPHMSQLRFNFDKTQIVCHQAMNLLEYINNLTDIRQGFDARMLTSKLRMLRVQSSHLKNKEGKSYLRRYTIFGFSAQNAKQERIADKNMTIEEYFLSEYQIILRRPDLPMIKTNPVRDIFVPIELLEILPYQKVGEDGKIVAEVIRYAAIPPLDRLEKLKKAVRDLGLADRADKYMKNYMIEIDPNLITVCARVLDGPEVIFGKQRKELIRLGKWDIRGKGFCKPYNKNVNWAFFAVGTERDYQRNEKCLFDVEEKLPAAAGQVGINMSNNFQFNYVSYQQIENLASNLINESEKSQRKLDLLVFVVRKDEDYRAVKRFGDMVCGIATQCMKLDNLARQRNLDQYLGNIMLKINGKLGGQNWELPAITKSTFTPIKDPFMVFGIDILHLSAIKNDLTKSIAAMVGSLDHTATTYSAVIRQQVSKKERSIIEVVLEMEDMVHTLLLKFYQVNKSLKPKHLIFYRDSVAEGQFEIVFKHEIIAIQNACEKLEKGFQPQITYIVVQKGHHIRFFPKDPNQGVGRSGNAPSGTIVDKDITHCREFDFYLCSHEGIQGTSQPTHYHVLFDENNWNSDDLQSFTYFLCHVYAGCTRSVSYPAPTYYAHLAAFRGKTLLGQPDSDNSSVSLEHMSETSDSIISVNDFHLDKLFFV